MAWTRLDDGFADHPKVAPLSDPAFRAFVAGLGYANRYLTDGEIHAHELRKNVAPKVRRELVAAELWHERDDGGIDIHDFLEYNRPAETVRAERKANAERQRRFRDSHRDPETGQFTTPRNAVTNGVSNGVSNAAPTRPDPTRPNPDPSDGFQEEEQQLSALDVAGVDPGNQPLVAELLHEIRDRDALTEQFILAIASRASEAGLVHTLEALRQRRRRKPKLVSESKYARHVLAEYVGNGNGERTIEATS